MTEQLAGHATEATKRETRLRLAMFGEIGVAAANLGALIALT